MVSVTLEKVTKLFGTVRAVNDVSLHIEEGELFFLLGPSGCGKTTALRIVAGFYEPDEGTLKFGDRVMNTVPPHRRNTGMVFQNYALWPHLNVYENVAYGLNLRSVPRAEKDERVWKALAAVRMEAHADKSPNQLSGGQQQRIALARALVIEPDLLLLDEPLSNLDAKLRLDMRAEIRRLHRETGLTAIYVTHDQKEALSMADRIAIMRDGRIEQVGTPREVYTRPANAFVANFIGETNFLDGTVTEVRDGACVVETAIGPLAAADLTETLPLGEPVRCSVRPESVYLASGHPETNETGSGTTHLPQSAIRNSQSTNRFPAKVLSLTYLGDVEEYWLQVRDAQEMKAVRHNPGVHERREGDAVMVWIDPRDVVVLREQGN